MRIARVLTRLNLGGPARQCLASDPLLMKAGCTVRVYCGTSEAGEGDLYEEYRARGIDVVRVPGLVRGMAPAGDVRAWMWLRKELRAFAPDVVHTHASKAGALGRRALKGLDHVARVHTFHGHVLEGYFPAPVSKAMIALETRAAAATDRIVAVSHATADDLVRLGVVQDERRLIVVPPGMDLDPLLAVQGRSAVLRPLIGAGERDVVVGIIGRLAEVKRPELALEVLELLHQRYPQLHMVWVGDGDQRGLLERRIAALSTTLQARAHMLGARTDMPAVLADLDAVMLVSRSEGAPVALIEAAAAAKPVLATNVGGVSEVVAHERTGWLGNDMTELAFGLSQWLDTPQLLTATGQRARLRVQARHSAQHLADRLLEIYRIVVKERTCAS